MKAVILAAGIGTRFRPFTYTKPKVLLPLANKPIIQYIVEDLMALKEEGTTIDEIFIVTNYLEEKIKAFFADWDPDVKMTFVHQESIGGTGDALKAVSGMVNEDFIMVNGDEVFGPETFAKLLKAFQDETALAIVAAYPSEHPEKYGVIVKDDMDVLQDIIEKPANPTGNLVTAGAYVFSPRVFEFLEKIGKSPRGEYELTDAVKKMAVETCRVFVEKVDKWQGLSELWDIFEANRIRIEQRLKEEYKENVILGKDVELKPGVHIEGSVMIGDGSVIGPNCYIRGSTSIGRNCRIGNGVEVKNSIIMDNSNVPHLSYVGDSIVGENCNFGAGTITANLRHDFRNVKVLVKGTTADSGVPKLGVFAADWTKTGIGTMIYPGMVMGPFAWTAPNETVDCNVEPFTMLGPAGKTRIVKEKIDDVVKGEGERKFLKRLYEELEDVQY